MARDLKEAVKMFEAIRDDLPNFYEDALRAVGQNFLSAVIRLSPVTENYTYEGENGPVKVSGGALRRGWIGETEPGNEPSPSEIESYIRKLRTGGYKITLSNSVEYAMYVNDGHKQQPNRYVPAIGKRLKNSWVDGLHFKEKAEHEIEPHLQTIYDSVLKEYYQKWSRL